MSTECKSCGAQIDSAATSCPYCQSAVARAVQRIPEPPPVPTATVLPPTVPGKPKGNVGVLIILLVLFWPAAIIYYISKSWK